VLGVGVARGAPSEPRPRLVDPYRDFIEKTLAQYPTLRATRIYDMVRARGYTGGVRNLRAYVRTVRPRPRREVYLSTEPLIGEQSQVDWAYVGKLSVDGTERALWLFVIVLSHSRALWGELVIDLTVHSLCRSLVRAAAFFGGVTRQWLFDNPKIVVLERRGDAVRFHPRLLELCGALRVEPRLCAVGRPEHKGRVERAIRYLRDRFLGGRTITSVEDGNRALRQFLDEVAHPRPHPSLAPRTVADVLSLERGRLLPLPQSMPCTDLVQAVAVDSQAFIRFDTNRYSVPTAYAHRTLTLVADDGVVRLLDGDTEVARHDRSYARRLTVEHPEHRAELVTQRRAARELKGRDRLCHVAPEFARLVEHWARRGLPLATPIRRAVQLLDLYGDDVFRAAISELIAGGLGDVGALAVACDRLRRARRQPVPVDIALPAHVVDRDVIPHDLESYDAD
jgi:transposase